MADLKITKPAPDSLEANVQFPGTKSRPDGMAATVFSGMSNGGTQTSMMNITYTSGPYKGVSVTVSRDLDEHGKPKPDALTTKVENQQGVRMDPQRHPLASGAVLHAAEFAPQVLRSPEYQAIVSGGQGAKLAGSANDFAGAIEHKAKTGLVPPAATQLYNPR